MRCDLNRGTSCILLRTLGIVLHEIQRQQESPLTRRIRKERSFTTTYAHRYTKYSQIRFLILTGGIEKSFDLMSHDHICSISFTKFPKREKSWQGRFQTKKRAPVHYMGRQREIKPRTVILLVACSMYYCAGATLENYGVKTNTNKANVRYFYPNVRFPKRT